MGTTEKHLQEELAQAEEAVRKAKAALAARDKLTPEQNLAEELHSRLCHWNHIDGCGWDYESTNPWTQGYAHKEYLERAKRVLKVADAKTVIDVLDSVK